MKSHIPNLAKVLTITTLMTAYSCNYHVEKCCDKDHKKSKNYHSKTKTTPKSLDVVQDDYVNLLNQENELLQRKNDSLEQIANKNDPNCFTIESTTEHDIYYKKD